MLKMIEIFMGGGAGCLSRYAVSNMMLGRFSRLFPYGILTVNVLGSFIMGICAALFLQQLKTSMHHPFVAIVMVGFLGGFTTFSSFSLDTFQLLHDGRLMAALVNIAANVLLCVAATAVGYLLFNR